MQKKMYSINFNGTRKVFYLSLHYNGANSYLFLNGIEMVKFKAKDSEIVATLKLWRRGVVVITTAQLHSTNPELRFFAGSNPACGVSEIRNRDDIWQWS